MSIFSSNTLREWPRPTGAVWFALVVCAVLRVAFVAFPDFLFLIPQDEAHYLSARNEVRYLHEENPAPKAIVLGTSRLTRLDATCLAGPLDIDPAEVSNYAAPALTFWHANTFLRRQPGVLRDVKVIVIDLLPYQLFEGDIFNEESNYFLRLATSQEKRGIRGARGRFVAWSDLVFPMWSERRRVAEWYTGARDLGLRTNERRTAFLQHAIPPLPGNVARRAEGAEAMETYASEDPIPSPIQTRALEDLIDRLPDDTRLLLVWLPVAPEFAARLMGDGPHAQQYRAFEEHLRAIDHSRVRVLWADAMEDYGIVPRDFTDLVHFSEEGMEKVCGLIGDELAAWLPDATR